MQHQTARASDIKLVDARSGKPFPCGLPADRVEFATQRSSCDATVAGYAHAFRRELTAGGVNGVLYAETLTIGFALHLLSRYAVAKPKPPLPRGKLNPFQLRTVVDYIQSNLDKDASLLALAERANVSPFHFARQFGQLWAWRRISSCCANAFRDPSRS